MRHTRQSKKKVNKKLKENEILLGILERWDTNVKKEKENLKMIKATNERDTKRLKKKEEEFQQLETVITLFIICNISFFQKKRPWN